LRQTYGFPGSERDLLSRGLVPAGFLDGRKARILLSVLLASGRDLDGVRTAFEQVNDSVSLPDPARPVPADA
jgi:L-asparaginase